MLVVNESQPVPRSSSVYSAYFVANGNVELDVSPPTDICHFIVRFRFGFSSPIFIDHNRFFTLLFKPFTRILVYLDIQDLWGLLRFPFSKEKNE